MEFCCGESGLRKLLRAVVWSVTVSVMCLMFGAAFVPQSQIGCCTSHTAAISEPLVVHSPVFRRAETYEYKVPPGPATLVRQQAALNNTQVAQSIEQELWPAYGYYNDVYEGPSIFSGGDYWGREFDENFNRVFPNIPPPLGVCNGLLGSFLCQCRQVQYTISDWS